MKNRLLLILLICAMALSGCGGVNLPSADAAGASDTAGVEGGSDTADISKNGAGSDVTGAAGKSDAGSGEGSETGAAEQEPFEYNAHLYSSLIAQEVPQEYWDSLYNLCDALRAGEDSFECYGREAYDWCMDSGTLANLMPAACMKISGGTDTGTIRYNMPADEFAGREAEFEKLVEGILNSTIEKDDTDYEKCLKLYDYMETNYSYDYDGRPEGMNDDGYIYFTLQSHSGQCIDFAGVYAFLLLQAGVEAVSVGCSDGVDHEWTYVLVNGRGYHIDPTWALRESADSGQLYLSYFMMSDEIREMEGCPVGDLTVQLLPRFWANMSSVSFAADDDSYYLGEYSVFESMDEDRKILHYRDIHGREHLLYYGKMADR